MSGSIISMLVVIIAFVALLVWVFKPGNRKRFDDYAQIPLNDELADADATTSRSGAKP